MRIRPLLITAAAIGLVYLGVGAGMLRFALDSRVLPRVTASRHTDAPLLWRISGDDGNALLVRRHGVAKVGCVVFFPGQHGLIDAYAEGLFPAFVKQGVTVLAVAYPGQNGAPGTAHLAEIQSLAAQVVVAALAACPGHPVVLYGRSFGAMVAAYAAGDAHPTGLILESAAPSFSSALDWRLRSRWYLKPLAWLPVGKLLAHDYSLTEALSHTANMPAVLFQGTADRETPWSALGAAGIPVNVQLVMVSGGSHSNTFHVAREQIVRTALSMLRTPSDPKGAFPQASPH